jgi:predicted secreted protein
MKTIMLGSLITALSLGAWATEGVQGPLETRTIVVQEKPNPGQVAVAVGENFRIELPGNYKAPYEWVVTELDPEMVAMEKKFIMAPSGKTGGQDTFVFPARALKPGKTILLLEYRKEGEKGPPIKTFKLAVTVAEGPAAPVGAQTSEQSVHPKEPSATTTPDTAGIFPGYRAVSLPLPGHQLAFLKKGDYVDVMVTFEAKMANQRKEKLTATILQNVKVIDVLKPAKMEERGVVQLLVNPNEAQYAALSDARGDLHVVLRATGDFEMHPMEMASFRKLFR